MKLPNWAKIVWWLFLLLIISVILYLRWNALITGKATAFDILISLIFIALMLVPIFSEIELFGIKLKKELEDLKHTVEIKLGDIKNDIRNNQTQNLYTTFQGYGPPPPDNKLHELEGEIERIINSKIKEYSAFSVKDSEDLTNVPYQNIEMFKIRYNIEKRIRNIWEYRFENQNQSFGQRHLPIMKMLQDLRKYEIINDEFYSILREILAICNYAIHGEKLSENQMSFVTKYSPSLLEYLNETH